jgi:hypothetical protein
MQQGTFGTAMRYLVAVGTLVSSFALCACGGGSSGTNVSTTVGVTNATVVAVQTVAFLIPTGQVFDPSLSGAVTLTFNTTPPNTFSLVGPGGATATGVVSYGSTSGATVGSCTFTFLTTGGLIAGVGSVTIPSCSLLVTANDVETGGSQVSGSVTLSFSAAEGTVTSNAVTLPVLLNGNSELFVVNPAGQQVDMGIVA